MEVAVETPTGADAFLDDIRASWATWRNIPLLPVVTAGVALISAVTVPSHGSFPVLVAGISIGLFSLGLLGTQFIWYRRAFDRQPVHAGELIPLTSGFIARYFSLYFLAAVPLVAPLVVAIYTRAFDAASPVWRIGPLIYFLVLAIPLTFVNPSLAFATRKVTRAIPIGLRILTQGWPRDWTYAVIPGGVGASLGGVYLSTPAPWRPAPGIFASLLSLVFAGAIARYYLRTAPGSSEKGDYRAADAPGLAEGDGSRPGP